MAKRLRLSKEDTNRGRNAMPGTRQQTPIEEIELLDGSHGVRWVLPTNFDGVAGGNPTKSKRELRSRASTFEAQGATDSAKAARERAKNIEGHEKLSDKLTKELKAETLKKRASVSDASLYDKLRYKVNKVTGLKKGGSVSKRADGCAQRGKTRGKMV